MTRPVAIVAGDTALAECAGLLRDDFASFASWFFRELNARTRFAMNWHFEVMAGDPRNGPQRPAVRGGGGARRPDQAADHQRTAAPPEVAPASVAVPAWCLGHDPSVQIVCVSYAQDLAHKLSRDCRQIVASARYQRLFPTRLSPRHQAVPEFETTAQGGRVSTSGGLTGRGADIIIIDDPLKPEEALSQAQRQAANEWYDHTLYSG